MSDVQKWLQEVRKLDAELLDHMGVRGVEHPQLGSAVAFPYSKGGKAYAAKFRKVDQKEWRSSQGVSRGLYNEDALSQDGPVVITEGEVDCLSVIQAGYTRCVSLPDGWTEDGGKREVLVSAEDGLRKSPYVIVAGDNDEVGRSLPKVVANILRGHDVRYATWPEGCKDANDVLVKFGEGELSRCLTDARRVDPEGGVITGISDMPPLASRRVLRIGMSPFDYTLAFEVGAMSVGTGIPGHGKSTFTTFAAYHVALSEDIKVGFMSFETHPHRTRDHLCRLKTNRGWDDLSERQRAETAHFLDRYFRIVHRTFDVSSHHLGWLENMIYALAVRDNCKLIVIDPWNELEHLPQPGESMTSYINFALQKIRQWAEQFNCHIIVVAHPKKMTTEGKEKPPVGYDVADSAAFANKPALGFTVHMTEKDDEEFVQILTWKVRDTQLYRIEKGSIKLTFNKTNMTYRKFESAKAYQSEAAQ